MKTTDSAPRHTNPPMESPCKGSRAGYTRAGVGHQELNKANGQAKKAEHDLGQEQSKDFMGERSTGRSCSSIYYIL